MKIGLVSDIHAMPEPLAEALLIFKHHAVDKIICCGDILGYGNRVAETIELVIASQSVCIKGNHEAWLTNRPQQISAKHKQFITDLPLHLQFTIGEDVVYAVHASPPDNLEGGIRLLDQDGNLLADKMRTCKKELEKYSFSVLVVGHTHQVYAEQLGSILVINPGSTCFNHSCAILTLPDKNVEFFSLSSQRILKSWNWSNNVLPI